MNGFWTGGRWALLEALWSERRRLERERDAEPDEERRREIEREREELREQSRSADRLLF